MRQALLTATLLLVAPLAAAPVYASSCAVRLRVPASGSMAKAALHSLIERLPEPPRTATPLVAASATGPAHPLSAWHVLDFDTPRARDRCLAVLRAQPEVAFVEPVRVWSLAPGERVPAGSGAQETPWNVERVGAPAALQEIEPDTTLLVAVIDTGADLEHPDLRARLWRNDDPPGNATQDDDATDQNGDGFVDDWERDDDDDNGYVDDHSGYDFTDAPGQGGVGDALERDADPSDENGHGTHVAGIIAADGRLRGVAPFVRLMPVRAAFDRAFGGGALETDDAAAAIVYAVDNGARVLNLSWGDSEESRLVREAIEYALDRDVVVVAAAGNGSSTAPHYPSGDPRVIAVAASNRNGTRAGFSNFGPGVEIAAPGEEFPFPGAGIRSLEPTALVPGGLGERRGTSMSAPHVAGAAAILLSRADRPDARRVRALLAAGARRRSDADWDSELGHGELDVLASLRTEDDLVVRVLGPPHAYRAGRLTLLGSVLSGDVPRRSLVARHLGSGLVLDLVRDISGQVVADTLVHVAFSEPEGLWEYVLAAETGDGRRREEHGTFVVDRSAPQIDTLTVTSGWRAGEPRWLLRVRTDEPVSTRVLANDTTWLADAGFSTRVQIEAAARTTGAATWDVELENVAGLTTRTQVAQPARLAPWPQQSALVELDVSTDLLLEPVHGVAADGRRVVWGRAPGASGTVQAWGVDADRLVPRIDTGRAGRPIAFADANGDAAGDLLFHTFDGQVVWLLTRSGALDPDSVGAQVAASRGLGFFQLDADAAYEAILSTDDSLFIHDDAVAGPPVRVQFLLNPNRSGFNVWGADAAVGDVDGDGRIEIVCGDAEGYVTVFENRGMGFVVEQTLDTGGVYAYDLSLLPDGGFVVGRQRTADPTGDGFPSAPYDFLEFVAGLETNRYPFLAVENVLRAGSTAERSPASGQVWLALAQADDLYLLRGTAPREPVTRVAIVDGTPPVLADLDADGRMEMAVRSADGARLYRVRESGRGPHALRSESLGPKRLRLTWAPGDSGVSRVRRTRSGTTVVLVETTAGVWIDSTVAPLVEYVFDVQEIVDGRVRATSNTVVARAQPRPRLGAASAVGEASLRLVFTNPLHAATLEPRRVAVWGADAEPRRVLQLVRGEAGRALDVVVDAPLGCGDVRVAVDSLRDDQHGLLDPPHAELTLPGACARVPFYVVHAALSDDAQAIDVEFNREPAAAALEVGNYRLTWNGAPQPLASVEAIDTVRYRLHPAPGIAFLARGLPYRLQLDPALVAAGDLQPLEPSNTIYRVQVEGRGATHLFPYPNPATPSDAQVVFAEAAPDTRVRIYNLEGELVRELQGATSGGLRWDLRATNGGRVGSGVYVYVARDARGTSRGRIAVVR